MTTRRPPRVWLLTNAPSPYQVEFFAALARSGRVALDVRFLRDDFRGTRWRPSGAPPFAHRTLRGLLPAGGRDELQFHPGALGELIRSDHDFYVLSGQWTSPTFLGCASALWAMRKPWAAWLERPRPGESAGGGARNASARSRPAKALRAAMLGALVRMAAQVWCIGSAAAEAYRRLGAKAEKLRVVPYLCDLERFGRPERLEVDRLRRRRRLEGKLVYLFSGQLIRRKGVDVLLEAFERVAARHASATLLILGDGPERPALQSATAAACRDRVVFAGHVDQRELPLYFGLADVFVFPSRHDGWGVVINEACAAGLPIVASRAAGAALDLVVEQRNGYLVEADDPAALADRMERLASCRETLVAFGLASRQIVRSFSPEHGVDRFVAAVEDGVSLGERRRGALKWL